MELRLLEFHINNHKFAVDCALDVIKEGEHKREALEGLEMSMLNMLDHLGKVLMPLRMKDKDNELSGGEVFSVG